jgi:hypothetical protein
VARLFDSELAAGESDRCALPNTTDTARRTGESFWPNDRPETHYGPNGGGHIRAATTAAFYVISDESSRLSQSSKAGFGG